MTQLSQATTRRIALLLLVLPLLLLACGSGAGGIAPEATAAVPFVGNVTPAAAPTVTESAAADAASAAGIVAATTGETDAAGIPVGFTEDGAPYRGRPDAPVVMEAFSDFQCPYCGRFAQDTMSALLENQIAAGEVVFVFYDFPLNAIHPQAAAAANAARCAGAEGAAAYWAMHDRLFANIDEWANEAAADVFRVYGEELGLSTESFGACLDEDRYGEAVAADLALGEGRGVSSTPSFFLNDQPVVGAYPLDYFNQAIAAAKAGETITAVAETEPQDPAVKPTPATIVMDDVAAERGDAGAPVTIIEYTDYQCPYCARHVAETWPRLLSEMIDTGRVRYAIKDFPLDSIHPQARVASAAARCAGEQDAYWEMHDALFARQTEWGVEDPMPIFTALATDLGLDGEAFAACLSSGRHDAAIQRNQDEGFALGVNGTPAFFINGFPVSGAQPYELFEYAVGLAEQGTLADAYVQSAVEATPTPSGPVEVETTGAYSIGEPDAPVVIVEFTDFQCPYCSRHFEQTFPRIKADYIDTGKVRYVFMDFPLSSIHPQAQLASEAARCAGDQGGYLDMHHALFARQDEWNGRSDADAVFNDFAAELSLDTAAFGDCLASRRHEAAVLADVEQGISLGVNGTPAFFLNGNFLSGAQPFAVFQEVIEGLLADAS